MPELEAALDGERLRSGATLELLSKFGGPWGMRAHRKAVANFLAKRGKKAPAGLSEAIDAALRCASIEPEGAREVEDALVGACARDLARIIAERAELDRRILTLLAKDRDFNNLLTMPGVGVKTAASIVADVDIKRFDDAFKLGRYMGLAPRVAKSGSSIDRTWSDRRGNARLRHAMFCSAFCALRRMAKHAKRGQIYAAEPLRKKPLPELDIKVGTPPRKFCRDRCATQKNPPFSEIESPSFCMKRDDVCKRHTRFLTRCDLYLELLESLSQA